MTHITRADAIYAGTLAGIVAGIVMGMASMFMSMATGGGFWMPLKKISVTLLGPSAIDEAGFQTMPVMVGMMIHFLTAIVFGMLFALWGGRSSYGPAIGWGVAYGLAIWLIMQFAVLPVVNPVMANMPPLRFAILHVVFGGALGSYPAFLETEAERRRKSSAERAA